MDYLQVRISSAEHLQLLTFKPSISGIHLVLGIKEISGAMGRLLGSRHSDRICARCRGSTNRNPSAAMDRSQYSLLGDAPHDDDDADAMIAASPIDTNASKSQDSPKDFR